MFVAVGNSPSSGSTFLGDLLDSSPMSVCGSELNIFTNQKIYSDFLGYQKKPFTCSGCSSLYITRNCLNTQYLHEYDLNDEKYMKLLNSSHNASEFFEKFGQYFCRFRERSSAIWFEKTPQNISILDRYLHEFPDNYFLHIVRNPVFVISSLMQRGFSPGVACFTWLFDVSKYIAFESEKTILIRYEDFIASPWGSVSSIIAKLSGEIISPEDIEKSYFNNSYRRNLDKSINSWGVNRFGEGPKNANKKIIPKPLLKKIKQVLEYRISDEWAKENEVPAISFKDAIEHFGYSSEIENMLSNIEPSNNTIFTFRDIMFLTKKYLYTKLTCDNCSKPIIRLVERV